MARTQLFGRIRLAIANARAALPDAPPPAPRAISRRSALLLMTAAAYCTVRALEHAGTKWLALAGVALGFAFLAHAHISRVPQTTTS